MSALLYYSISSTLTEDEIIEVDRRVAKNRKTVYIFVRNFAANGKDGTKRIILIIALGSVIWFSNLESAEAIGLSMPHTPVVRVQQDYKDTYETKVAPTVSAKLDKITFIKSRELPICIYMMDERFLKTSETIKLINKIRGGGLIEAATALVVIVIMWQILGVGIEGFQLPIVPANGGVHRPANGGIQQKINHPKHGGRTTVRMSQSNQCPAHQTQIEGFMKNGKVDLRRCHDEVNRRASEIGCSDFECSLERFKALATENGKVTSTTAREAITVLQGEMNGKTYRE